MNSKFMLGIVVVSICLTIFLSLYSDSISVSQIEAQGYSMSEYELHSYLEQMKGHLDASILNVENNNSVLALAHALHPIEEIVDRINDKLIQSNETLAEEFSKKLNEYVKTVQTNNLPKISIQKIGLEKLLNDALDQSIPIEKRNQNRDYVLNVTAELITVASEEFNEAVKNGQIISLLEYQDGQQFIKRAIMLLEQSRDFLTNDDDKYINKLKELQKDLDSKRDPSYVDMDVKDMLCQIKKGLYC